MQALNEAASAESKAAVGLAVLAWGRIQLLSGNAAVPNGSTVYS